jgi:hypothetical protein
MDRRTYLSRSGIIIGGLFFSGSIISLFESCTTKADLKHDYLVFSRADALLVSELAEVIIPRTDTPGAKDIGVEKKIDAAFYYNYEKEDKLSFFTGLDKVKSYCFKNYNKNFELLSISEKEKVMKYLKDDALVNKDNFYKQIYPLLKGLTVIAYFTSKEIAKNVLLFDPIPGSFDGDLSYEEIGGMWSINI